MDNPVAERRAGRFRITQGFLTEGPREISMIMRRVIVVRCEHNFMVGVFEYEAYSMDFRPLEVGETPPEYTFTFRASDLGTVELTGIEEVKK
jgi:hypothetical protein